MLIYNEKDQVRQKKYKVYSLDGEKSTRKFNVMLRPRSVLKEVRRLKESYSEME